MWIFPEREREREEGRERERTKIILHHTVQMSSFWLTHGKELLVEKLSNESIRASSRHAYIKVRRKERKKQHLLSRNSFADVHAYICSFYLPNFGKLVRPQFTHFSDKEMKTQGPRKGLSKVTQPICPQIRI